MGNRRACCPCPAHFGTGKISGIGKSLGTAIRDFRESVKSDDEPEEEPIESKPKEAGNSND
jgi:Sec-independent protein translocase protein TatA